MLTTFLTFVLSITIIYNIFIVATTHHEHNVMKFNVSNYQCTQMVVLTRHELMRLNIGQVLSLHVYGLM